MYCKCWFSGFSSGRGNFETAPHIDTWTNEKTVNGDKDVNIGGMHFINSGDSYVEWGCGRFCGHKLAIIGLVKYWPNCCVLWPCRLQFIICSNQLN